MSFNYTNGTQVNYRLKALILEVVDNQLKDNNPPETKATLDRLIASGDSERQAREKIASVVVNYIYDILHDGKKFNVKKYIRDLKALK